MRVAYNKYSDTIRCVETNCRIMSFVNPPDGMWCLDLDRAVPMREATKIFQRLHGALLGYNADPQQYVDMINDALTERLYLVFRGRKVPVYWRGELNYRGIKMLCNALGYPVTDSFSCTHNVVHNTVEYWLNVKADRASLNITKFKA